MTRLISIRAGILTLLMSFFGIVGMGQAIGEDATSIELDSRAALKSLYSSSPGARALGENAKAILVFPKITKAGFIVGGQYGQGVMLVNNRVSGHYETMAASYGIQAGAQTFAYAIFFMTEKAVSEFRSSDNFQVGVGPSIVVLDQGAARDVNTLTSKADIYAMIFSQSGLMAGAGIQGSKITKIDK